MTLPFKLPRWAWYALGALVLLAAFWFALDQYGDKRFAQGEAKANAAWQAASDKLLDKAANAKTEADKKANARAAEYAAAVETEKEKIDAATANGGSAFDVMFGN